MAYTTPKAGAPAHKVNMKAGTTPSKLKGLKGPKQQAKLRKAAGVPVHGGATTVGDMMQAMVG